MPLSAFNDFLKLLKQHPEHRFVLCRDDGSPQAVLLSWEEYSAFLAQQKKPRAQEDLTGNGHFDRVISTRSGKDQEIKNTPQQPSLKQSESTNTPTRYEPPPLDEWDRMMEQVSAMTEPVLAAPKEQEEEQYLFESVE